MKEKCYICCDLKSFYASVECVERGLDPMTTNLVVADKRRTDKTICLAVSPSLKAYGISGRARLFEVVQKVKEVNLRRQRQAPGRRLTGASWHDRSVQENPSLALDYLVAPPRMAHYIDWSTRIYSIYLKYIAPEDIFPYSIDEVFMDVTNQLVLTVGYDRENLDDPGRRQNYHGPVTTDRYGRSIPKHAVGTENFTYTSSANDLQKAAATLYDRIVDKNLLIRRLSISANKLLDEAEAPNGHEAEQMDLFTDYSVREQQEQAGEAAHARERKLQEAMLGIKKRYGKNAILKGMNLEDGATAKERNQTIGGHQA